jgi:hypothetical protein
VVFSMQIEEVRWHSFQEFITAVAVVNSDIKFL